MIVNISVYCEMIFFMDWINIDISASIKATSIPYDTMCTFILFLL